MPVTRVSALAWLLCLAASTLLTTIFVQVMLTQSYDKGGKVTQGELPAKTLLRARNSSNEQAHATTHADAKQKRLTCRHGRHNNVVFIKCMKCATETLGTIFRRYGFVHNLSVVLPTRKRIYLGWPFPMTHQDYRPSAKGFNLLFEHAVYNASFMHALMREPDTKYVVMIREPFDLFVSILNYFNVFEIVQAPVRHGPLAVQKYLRRLRHFESVYRSSAAAAKRFCVPDNFSVTHNPLAHCLGMPVGFTPGQRSIADDVDVVRRRIRVLDSELDLVMLKEYFPESLTLLKRTMCWGMKEVLYHRTNIGAYNYTKSSLGAQDRRLHRRWSAADYELYSHFNRSFWAKVEAEGADFWHEVSALRRVQHRVSLFCHNFTGTKISNRSTTTTPWVPSTGPEPSIHFAASRWSRAFSVGASYCRLMAAPLLDMLKDRHLRDPEPELIDFPSDPAHKPLC